MEQEGKEDAAAASRTRPVQRSDRLDRWARRAVAPPVSVDLLASRPVRLLFDAASVDCNKRSQLDIFI